MYMHANTSTGKCSAVRWPHRCNPTIFQATGATVAPHAIAKHGVGMRPISPPLEAPPRLRLGPVGQHYTGKPFSRRTLVLSSPPPFRNGRRCTALLPLVASSRGGMSPAAPSHRSQTRAPPQTSTVLSAGHTPSSWQHPPTSDAL